MTIGWHIAATMVAALFPASAADRARRACRVDCARERNESLK